MSPTQLNLALKPCEGIKRHESKFFQVHSEYLHILDKTEETAKVLWVLEYLSKPLWEKTNDPSGWWVRANSAKFIQLLSETINRKTVYSKLAILEESGIVSVDRSIAYHFNLYRLNVEVLNKLLSSKWSVRQGTDTAKAVCPSKDSSLSVEGPMSVLSVSDLYIYKKEELEEEKTFRENEPLNPLSVHPGKEENKIQEATQMSETEIILKRYVDTPKSQKSAKFKNTNLRKLNDLFGDKIDKLVEQYGFHTTLQAMEKFLEDPYWQSEGLQLYAFLKQSDRYLDGIPGDEGSLINGMDANLAVENSTTVVSPVRPYPIRPASAQATSQPIVEIVPVDLSRKKVTRRNEMLFLMQQVDEKLYHAANFETQDLDEIAGSVIDSWFDRAVEAFTLKYKVTPTVTTTRLEIY